MKAKRQLISLILLAVLAFTFLMFLFTLVETSGKDGAPILTIPAQ